MARKYHHDYYARKKFLAHTVKQASEVAILAADTVKLHDTEQQVALEPRWIETGG
jgi:hypothetical protein